ncbi:hypothetical protein RM572_03690 [Streptomyces sp. DSM 42041]|uniref:Secreted protein n=1 Tax=Streptomyces hazeniae TaxID=3075538 RepID=A0ABU2NM98_9ACTN|nr:hypothetical protein [Streptomyces sp. DSM 42041]MDT0377875.1 hypothetical protein [Streptomyces sp. DSM 42041]
MPRPTAAQFAYGALTVVLATLAMLLLSQTRSGTGIVVIAVAALSLGLLVSCTAAARTPSGRSVPARTVPAAARAHVPERTAARSEPAHRTPASLRR